MTETAFDFEVLNTYGVTQADFAGLVGVSRVTVNLWCNGKNPSKYLVERIEGLLTNVRKAGEKGLLPLTRPRKQSREDRQQALKTAIGLV